MDDIEFKPYDTDNPKRIGTKNDADGDSDEKRNSHEIKSKPRNFTIIIYLLIAIVAFFSYRYYQKTVLYPNQTKSELQEIRSALYHYKESFNDYPTQLTELTKGRPLREIWLTDAWENPYRYEVDKNRQTFIVTSAGNDGKFGTNDDIQTE
jgi:general secretion pathway protein G